MGPGMPLSIAAMWVQQGNSWDYKFWEVSLTLDAEANCAALSAALIEADPRSGGLRIPDLYLSKRFRTDGAQLPDLDASRDGDHVLE